jgi:septal ring factor EnvC (AmiA/AmiB activator)
MPIAERDYWRNDQFRPKQKKTPKFTWGFVGLLLLALFASGLPMKIYNEITIHHDQKIRSYLEQRERYYSSSDQSFKLLLTKLKENNGNPSRLSLDISETNVTLTQNYQKLIELDPPRDLKPFHDKTIEEFVIRQAAVNYLMSSDAVNAYKSEVLSTYIEESNQKISELRPLLIEGLQKADLRYQIEEDGTLTYWVKGDHMRLE